MAESAHQLTPDDEQSEERPRPQLASSGERSGPTHIGDLHAVPEPVYDDSGVEQTQPTRSRLRKVENGRSDEAGDNEDNLTKDGLQKAESQAGTSDSAGSATGSDIQSPQHENTVGRGYRGKIGSKLDSSSNLKKYIAGGGIIALLITITVVLFSFLNIFKLDGLMSNIEQKAFLRHNASLNSRSSKWISAYIEVRMLQVGDNPNDNMLFRSNRVDTNNPFTDWYKTMRASSFEQDVFEKQGIKFTSVVGADGKARLGKITVKGENPIDINGISNEDISKIVDKDPATLAKYEGLISIDTIDGNKAARLAIKDVVNKNTHWWQIYKQRFMRRAIQNMTGVRDWRFFETRRDKISSKAVDIRNRAIQKMVPDTTILGRVTLCLFGVNKCTPSDDVADRKLQADASADKFGATDNPDTSTQAEKDLEAKVAKNLDETVLSDTLKQLLTSIGIITKILNLPSTLDMLANVDSGLKNLVKYVVIARGAQAAGLFQVFETSRDQIKTGQVSAQEVNALMQNVDTAASSDGWTQVISGNSITPPGTTQTGGQCTQAAQALLQKDPQAYKQKYGVYSPLCADQQISSASNAQKIQDDYKNTIGGIVGPLVGAWEGAKKAPVLGIFVTWLDWLSNKLGNVFASVASAVLDALGLKGDVQKAVIWVFAKLSNFLGVTIIQGNELAGTFFNWLVQGGAYTAESSSRQEGASLTNPASQSASMDTIAQLEQDKKDTTSLYDRVASLDNTDSLAFKGATALSNVSSDPSGSVMASLSSLWSSSAKNIASIFMPRLYAATPNGYAASQFAGIKTYDYPQKCYDSDPLTAQPLDGTNAIQVLSNPRAYGVDHDPFTISDANRQALESWDVERSSDKFYTVIYDIIGENTDNGDSVAEQIYNCNLLDTAVRGSLGYLYGYAADAGSQVIGDSTSSNSSTSLPAPGVGPGTVSAPSASLQALAKQLLNNSNVSYPLDASSPNGSTKAVLQAVASGQAAPVTCRDGSAQGITSADLNPNILQAILDMAKTNKIGVNALTDKCHTTGSNHYKGLAVDFECQGVPFDINKNDGIAAKYGGQRNSETCSANSHWHYDFLTRP